jgi:hypothetical protein
VLGWLGLAMVLLDLARTLRLREVQGITDNARICP